MTALPQAAAADTSTLFVDFPRSKEILEKLRAIEASEELEPLFVVISERLASRTYEASAFVFILIELIYEFEDTASSDLGYLLPKIILSLTGNTGLALTAVDAFTEIKDSFLDGSGDEADATSRRSRDAPPATGDSLRAEPAPIPPEDEQRMTGLQVAQKRITDLGLMTRVSIEIAVRRPDRENVSRTLREIAHLRSALRTFEEHLIRSEQEVLRAAGILSDE